MSRQTRHISVSAAFYRRLRAAAKARDCSMASIIEDATRDLIPGSEVYAQLERRPGESWLGAALRQARLHELEDQVRATFYANLDKGQSRALAALNACLHWDVAVQTTEVSG